MEIPSAASSATGLAVVDKDGVIISANGAACQMLGVSLTELQGRSLLSLISDVSFDNGEGTGDEATPDSASQLMMRLCGGGTATLRNASSESRIRVAIRAEPTFDPASNELSTLVVILTLPVHPDVSGQSVARDRLILDQQRRAEQWLRKALSELRQRNAETSELLRSSRSALRVSDFRQKVKYIFDDCKRLIGAEAGYVLRCDGVPSVTETLLLDTGGLRSDSPLPLPMPVRGLMAEAFRTGRAVYENGFSHGGGAESIPAWHIPIDSILYAPLAVDGKVLGFLGLADKPGGFDEHDLELAAAFAELMAIAVRNNDEASRLEKSESRFRRLAENAPEIIVQYELRPVAGFSYITPIVTKMLGYSPEEFLGDPEMARKITHPDDLPLLEAHVSAASTVPVLCRWRHKDGRWIWIEQRSAHIRDDEGIVVAVVAIIRDVTEQKQAEDALMESEQRYRSVVAALEEGIILWSRDSSIVECNASAERILGIPRDQLRGRGHAAFDWTACLEDGTPLPADQHPAVLTLRTGKAYSNVVMGITRPRGGLIWLSVSSQPLFEEGKALPYGVVTSFSDISRQRQSEGSWRESQAQLAEAQRLAHLGSYVWDSGRGDVTFSEEARNILEIGAAGEQISAERFLELVHPDDRAAVGEAVRRSLNEGRAFSVECRISFPDGRVKHIQLLGRPQAGTIGSASTVTGTLTDITERRLLEERLMRAQRLETAGRIAGQVAHDFNNLLAPLALYPDLIRMQLSEGHPALKYCDGMLEVVQQMADINGDLLSLGRRGRSEHQVVDVNKIARQAVEGIVDKPDSLNIVANLAAELPSVKGSSAQLLRAITNLIVNAREAMHDTGTIVVKTDNVYVDEPFGHYDQVEVGEYVRLIVSDTGHGIPATIRDRIFDAFFTTKLADKKPGTGLGLSIALAVAEDHAGYLDVESREEEGTSFSLYLPLSRNGIEQPVRPDPRGGAETVLVVDDDRALREAVSELLRQLGYRAETVTSGEAALAYVLEKPVDLLILDMIMPNGMDGTETLRRVLEIRPGQRAIVLSGFAESDRVKEALRLGAGAFLRKPVSMDRLAAAVREELDRV